MSQIPEHVARAEFGMDHEGKEIGSENSFEARILAIDPKISPVERTVVLRPILQGLAPLDVSYAEAIVNHTMKEHFGLKDKEIKAFLADLSRHRKIAEKVRKEQTGTDAKPGSKPVYTARFPGLVDLVEHNGKPAFLIKEGDQLTIETQIEIDGAAYVPPPLKQIPWLLPNGQKVIDIYESEALSSCQEADRTLFDSLVSHLKEISDLPNETHYDLMAAWLMHTYLPEYCQYSPVICLFAVPERGKSRTGKGVIYAAYRGIYVESLRDAYMVRVASTFGASLFIDVRDVWRRAEKAGSDDILLLRYEKGAIVPRVLYPDKGPFRDIEYFEVFGPTIIGTNEGVHRILESRAIQINMPQSNRKFENDVTPEMALPLKERLLVFRARYFDDKLPDIRKPTMGRLGDIVKPLNQIIRLVAPDREADFLTLIQDIEQSRLVDKADSLDAEILLSIAQLKNEVQGGILATKRITDNLNHNKPERLKVSYQRVGKRTKAMGFQKGNTSSGAVAIIWNEQQIEQLKCSYGLHLTSVTSERPVTAGQPPGNTDVSDVTDVCQRLL